MANQEEGNFGNLTPRARQILLLAKQEAERFNHDYIGTEHLLLGILALNEGVAVNVLKSLGLNLQQLRIEVEKCCGVGGQTKTSGALPLTAESGPYLQLFGIIGLLTILAFCADLLVLRKKDL